jgi:group I intron endonuclease
MVASKFLNDREFVVYMLSFPSGKNYIGRTCNLKERLRNHRNKGSGCIYVQRSIEKYGIENVDVTILKTVKGAYAANYFETYFVSTFNTLAPYGCNCTPGGDGVNFTEEIAKKISIANTGRKLSEEHKLKLSIVGKGREKTDETRKKLSKAHTGKKFSAEHKLNMSIARKSLGIKLTDEQKEHLRQINIGKKMDPEAVKRCVETRISNGNHTHSDETKRKIGDANRGKEFSEEHIQKLKDAHVGRDYTPWRKYTDDEMLNAYKECGESMDCRRERKKRGEKIG